MARPPRFVLPGQPQHLIQRGNNRDAIFFSDTDRKVFLAYLRDACNRFRCDIHAYVLMTNHFHLVVSPHTEGGMSKLMQSVGRRYVQYVNLVRNRTGTLWEGRFRSTAIDSEHYLLACYRYVELNPVRAGMVAHPQDYPWSSYAHNALGKPSVLIRPHLLYESLGSVEERPRAYASLVDECLDDATIGVIRDATNKGWALANESYRRKLEEIAQSRAAPLPRGGRRAGAGRKRHTR